MWHLVSFKFFWHFRYLIIFKTIWWFHWRSTFSELMIKCNCMHRQCFLPATALACRSFLGGSECVELQYVTWGCILTLNKHVRPANVFAAVRRVHWTKNGGDCAWWLVQMTDADFLLGACSYKQRDACREEPIQYQAVHLRFPSSEPWSDSNVCTG